jgi:hypothetical protein
MKTKQQSSFFVTKRIFSRKPIHPIRQDRIVYCTHLNREFSQLNEKQKRQFIKEVRNIFGGDYHMMDYFEKQLNIKL